MNKAAKYQVYIKDWDGFTDWHNVDWIKFENNCIAVKFKNHCGDTERVFVSEDQIRETK